tara:strand:+ start:59841 stop:60251 length:411 start_codon:yes stop_codon:yes gene_type:complete
MKPTIGSKLKPIRIDPISTETMKDWAAFLRDPNPIHLDVEVVKAKGLGDAVINQGPINVAYVMNMLMANFPGCRIDTMSSRFTDNAYGGEAVETFGTVTNVETSADGLRVSCEVGLNADARSFVISGTATVFIPNP